MTDEKVREAIRAAGDKLLQIEVGGCTCLTKTPELEHHDARCHYRLAAEASQFLAAAELVRPMAGEGASDARKLGGYAVQALRGALYEAKVDADARPAIIGFFVNRWNEFFPSKDQIGS
jgi:hypothetical protein